LPRVIDMKAVVVIVVAFLLEATMVDGSLVTQDELQRVEQRFEQAIFALQEENAKLRQLVSLHEERLNGKQERRSMDANEVEQRAVSAVGMTESARRLTASPTYLAMPATQIHEFPDSHTCSNMGFSEAHPRLLSLDGSGPTVAPGTTAASSDVSLASVTAKDGAISEVQRFAAPFKVVHDSGCSAAPTLHLPLNTVADGTLSVGSTPVAVPQWSARVASSINSNPTTVGNAMFDVPGLTKTITLTKTSVVLAKYQISAYMEEGAIWNFIHTVMDVDSAQQTDTTCIQGMATNGGVRNYAVLGTCDGLYIGSLAAGTHTFKVKWRSESPVHAYSAGAANDYKFAHMQVLVL